MIKVLMHGCNGRMGQMIVNLVKEEKEMEIAAGVDKFDGVANDFPVFSCIGDCTVIFPKQEQRMNFWIIVPGRKRRWFCAPPGFPRSSL